MEVLCFDVFVYGRDRCCDVFVRWWEGGGEGGDDVTVDCETLHAAITR